MPQPGASLFPASSLAIRAGVRGTISAAVTEIGERRAVVVRADQTNRRGALAPTDGETLAVAAQVALDERRPLVAFLASSGADVNEGVAALHGWGTAARRLVQCSGVVPVLLVVTGPAVSGPALLLGLADHVVMTADAYAFLSGPRMVRAFTGVPIATSELGGAGTHARQSGVASMVVPDEEAGREAIIDLLAYLPDNNDNEPPLQDTDDPAERATPEAAQLIPDAGTGSYDVRRLIESLADDGLFLELRAQWAANLVTGFASFGGRPVGVVANQPMTIAGTLDIPASQKGARFVAFCDAFNLPLVTFVDTPGFYPGKDLEWRGMIRKGAQLAYAYARASVPRVSLTLRKSYGGAYIVMDSKRMGSDLSLAWPSAEIAVMGARGAVEILHRRSDRADRPALERQYEDRFLNPYVAAERGLVDAIIEPAGTRAALCAAIASLSSKRERLAPRAHDNTPL